MLVLRTEGALINQLSFSNSNQTVSCLQAKMGDSQDYDQLLKNNLKLQNDLEVAYQTLHDYKRQIQAAQKIEAEYQEEIKILQTEGTHEQQKLKEKVHQLEETITSLKVTYNEQVNYLESEVMSKEQEIDSLKKEIDEIIKITQAQKPETEDKLFDQVADLENQNYELNEKIFELEKSLELSEQQNVALQNSVKTLEDELNNYKETLNCKRQELEEANILLQNLKDDYLCVKLELDKLSSKPLDDQSQGNSLFAEVDDRRLQLQQNMKIMKTQYLEMKRERANYLQQITALRNEKAALIAERKAELEEKELDRNLISDTYEMQIQTLNDLIESYKKELKQKSSTESPNKYKFFDNMIALKNQEIEEMRQKFRTNSLNLTTLAYDLAQAKKQIRKYSLEIVELKNVIGELNVKIEEMQMVSPTEKIPEVTLPKSIVKKNDETVEENKENENKKVQFSENTVDSNITDRRKFRKGAKIFDAKPIEFKPKI